MVLLPLEYRQIMRSSICLTFIGFQRCTRIHINMHRFIASSAKFSTNPLSILLTKLLTHIELGLQKYCKTAYSRSAINQMWILKNSKELLDHLKSPNFNLITSIKSFDFSTLTLYTTIPHQNLKSRLATIIRNSFLHKKMKIGDTIFGFRWHFPLRQAKRLQFQYYKLSVPE